MKYSVTINKISSEKKAKLVARNIASRGGGYSFPELVEMLQGESFVLEHLSEADFDLVTTQLTELAVIHSTQKEVPPIRKEPVRTTAPVVKAKIKHVEKPVIRDEPVQEVLNTKKSKKRFVIPTALVFTLLFGGVTSLLMQSQEEKTFEIGQSSVGKTGIYKSHSGSINRDSEGNREANEFLDSADLKCGDAGSDAEKLYRFAIAFNRNNSNAWFGLLNCYRSIRKYDNISTIENEMELIFGSSPWSF